MDIQTQGISPRQARTDISYFNCNPTTFGLIFLFSFSISTILAQRSYQKAYFDDGILKEEGWIKSNKKSDYWKFYHFNGILEKEGHFENGNASKYWYFYRDDGTKESEGHYQDGMKSKWWLFYDDMEMINHKCQLKNNQKNGYCLMYENKKLVSARKYKAGKQIKEWTDLKSFKKENNLRDLQ